MIVRQFLHWLRSAPAADRADATAALARAYLHSELTGDDAAAAEGAMIMLLDDPSPLVRLALAQTLASSQKAPAAVVIALAGDQPEIASLILARSPLLIDTDLVDAVATGCDETQAAIARRALLPRSISAAIAEIGCAEACLVLIENTGADIAPFTLSRLIERHGHLAALRESMLARDDISVAMRQALMLKLSDALSGFVTARAWLTPERAERVTREACEKATVMLAASASPSEIRPLIGHLRETGQLNAGLILRALLSGNVDLFEESLADLSGLTLARVSGLIHDRSGPGFRALYEQAGLPASAYPAFREAVAVLQEENLHEIGGNSRLRRRMIERVLTGCERSALGEIEPLVTLLRRYATEAAREEARLFCDELVDGVHVHEDDRLIAA